METLAVAGMGAAVVAHFLGATFHALDSGKFNGYAKLHAVMGGYCLFVLVHHARKLNQ